MIFLFPQSRVRYRTLSAQIKPKALTYHAKDRLRKNTIEVAVGVRLAVTPG